MNEETGWKRYMPIGLALFNALISALGSSTTLPVATIEGLKGSSLLIAIIAAIIGTLLGLRKLGIKRAILELTIALIFFIAAILTYLWVIAQGGATWLELFLALLCYAFIFLTIFYAVTYLERLLLRTFKGKTKKSADADTVPN